MKATSKAPIPHKFNLPAPWGDDPLSEFITAAWSNAANTFVVDHERYEVLAEVDEAYRLLIDNLGGSPEPLSASLLVRSHASLIAAMSLALSGQIAESYTLMGSSLRAALQGLFVAGDSSRSAMWMSRNDDAASRQRVAAEFTGENMTGRLRQVDGATAAIFDKLYERTADRAGDPNTYADLVGTPDGTSSDFDFKSEYFVLGDEVQRFCLRSTAQVGICCLTIFYYVFPDKYRSLGLDARITKLRQGH